MSAFTATLGKAPRPARRVADKPARRATWLPAEAEAVRTLWPTATRQELLAALPGRTWNAIQRYATCHGIRRGNRGLPTCWLASEEQALRDLYPTKGTVATLAALPRHGYRAIRNRAHLLGLRVFRSPRATPKPMPAPVKPAPAPKPAKVPKPAPTPGTAKHRPLPAHGLKPMQVKASTRGNQSPATPNANARVNARRRAEAGKATPIAELVKALPANSPGRALYATTAREAGGPAAEVALRAWLAGK